MLPSTGLFRELQCPFYEPNSDESSCTRPFCHFKHAKKEQIVEGAIGEKPPQYNATPLTSSDGAKEPAIADNEGPSKKKPKLEYIPLPTIKSRKDYKESGGNVETEVTEGLVEELDIAEEQKEQEPETPDATETAAEKPQNVENKENIEDKDNITEPELEPEAAKLSETEETKIIIKTTEKEPRSSRASSHSSSSSRVRKSHHKSDKHRSSSRSASTSKHKSSSHHKSSSSHKSSRSSSRSTHKSSSSRSKHRSKRKHSRSRSRSKSRTKEKKRDKKEKSPAPKPPPKERSPEPIASDLESDEDDVMEQCKAIFEEFEAKPKIESPKVVEVKKEEPQDSTTNSEEPEIPGRNRVARENAITPLLQPVQKNIKLNPMQQIYKRTINNRRQMAPVSNMLAIRCAKEKLEALKNAQKPVPPTPVASISQTISQTASKFYGRTERKAHSKPEPEVPPAPPVLEMTSTKISANIRMQYYNMMVKHCLVIYPSFDDAWNRAQTEELAVMKKCNTANIYKSSALLCVNKLRKEALDSGNDADTKKTESHDLILAGKQNTSWSVNKKLKTDRSQIIGNFDIMPGEKAYKLVLECIATEENLRTYGYPRGDPGKVKMYAARPPLPPNKEERYCSRCSKVFKLQMYDEVHEDECNYHPKSAGYRRGSADNFHFCCQQPANTPGCMYSNYHVTDWQDYDNLKGYVRTLAKDTESFTKRDIYAFDCEMCYTRGGFELTRITVVSFVDERVVYDTLVKPDNEVVDYNTRYSGITEEQLSSCKTSIRDVQAVLLSMFHADTILIGHSLESDMKAVKLLHDKVVDTAILYPHKMGLPKKRALKTLCIENLKRIIQENDGGHDSSEDAIACVQLVKHYLRNRIV